VAELALGLRVLATLLESGLPVSKALAAMPELAPASWDPVLPVLARAVREGSPLGTALERSGLAVPPVVVGLVRAGEAGSGLARAVRRAAELMEETAATRAAVRAALVYPLILAVAGTVSVGILVGVVLPRFGAILADLGQALPASTRLVLQVSTLVRAGTLPAGFATLIIYATWRAWVLTDAGAVRWHELLLEVPVVGAVRRSAATARVCAALAALLESGVPLSTAFGHAARASGDAAIAARVLAARESVVAGARPSAAFLATNALTPVTARLVRAGEETGALATMLAHAARLEAERATRRVQAAVRLLEPALILVFGSLVALVAAALLQAIYSVRPM
jgi:general secretion pathway protein F